LHRAGAEVQIELFLQGGVIHAALGDQIGPTNLLVNVIFDPMAELRQLLRGLRWLGIWREDRVHGSSPTTSQVGDFEDAGGNRKYAVERMQNTGRDKAGRMSA
jgi:hypothetical protein